MRYKLGSKTGNLARVLAVMIITMVLLVGAMIPSAPVLADDSSAAYLMSNSPFTYGEGAIVSDGMGVWDSHSNKVCMSIVNVVWRLDGNADIDCGIYIADIEESEEVFTVYYEHGQKGVMEEAMLTALNASCYDYAESLFVPTDGVYEYQGDPVNWAIEVPGEGGMNVAPPTLETYIPQPVTDSRSVCRIPNMWLDNEGGTSSSYAFMSRNDSDDDGCLEWESIWDLGSLYPSMPMVMAGSSDLGEGGTQIIRAVLPFDTSDIPEGAIITGVYMRCVLYGAFRMDGDDATYVVGGTNNISFLPLTWTEESPEELGSYSETEFYGNYGAVNISDCPPEAFEGAMDSRVYVDIVLNEDGLDYINTEGFTALTLRESNDINKVCPPPSTAFYLFAGAAGTQYYTQYPESFLVVDWQMPDEDGTGLVSPTVAIMMDIVALLFLTGFIIGLLVLITKNEGLSLATKAGAITTIAIMAVVGVIIIESLVVAFK